MLKRALDVALSAIALVLLSPVIAVVGLLVRLCVGSPVFFRQYRPGLHGEPFEIRKFRTLTNARGADGDLLPDEERLQRFGAILRSTSLDELPELVNVLRGEMSLVGPRPLLEQYLPLYSPHQARRHEVRPGVTGWAQVNGRNALSWDEKFDHDIWYVENQTLMLDLRILFLTLKSVVTRRGVIAEGSATARHFTGNL
jgi:sugar transferase EpsL